MHVLALYQFTDKEFKKMFDTLIVLVDTRENFGDKIPNKNIMHILLRGDLNMKVKYAERGTFDAEKAARGLIELTNKLKRKNDQNKNVNKSDKSE